jgi:hypothetical protein
MFFFVLKGGISGALHPLLKARSEYRQVFLEMGFQVEQLFDLHFFQTNEKKIRKCRLLVTAKAVSGTLTVCFNLSSILFEMLTTPSSSK